MHDSSDLTARLARTAQQLLEDLPEPPRLGVVLGSGLGGFGESLDRARHVPFSDIPILPKPRVSGHPGMLSFGRVGSVPIVCQRGRLHLYEGRKPQEVVLPVRLLAALGCRIVLLTNAAGGIKADLAPGDFMLIRDHINLTGQNPLCGLANTFIDMSGAYDQSLAEAARRAGRELSIDLSEGVYAGLAGPSYETPAEIRMLKSFGADAVGMSTVLEVIALRHDAVRVGAMSCITNLAAGLTAGVLTHQEVEQRAELSRARFEALLTRWIELSPDPEAPTTSSGETAEFRRRQ